MKRKTYTPWNVVRNDGVIRIDDRTGFRVAEMIPTTPLQMQSNAELIVRAVNLYPDMVLVLKAIRAIIGGDYGTSALKKFGPITTDMAHNIATMTDEILWKAEESKIEQRFCIIPGHLYKCRCKDTLNITK